jgi:sigma-E factor negative regulatory protein RseA
MANKEQLSALMDGDLSDIEVLNELGTDPALQDTWSRYHLIGDAMRGDLPVNLQLDLSDSIMLALEDEPVILAPKPVQPVAPRAEAAGKVMPLVRRFGQQVGSMPLPPPWLPPSSSGCSSIRATTACRPTRCSTPYRSVAVRR